MRKKDLICTINLRKLTNLEQKVLSNSSSSVENPNYPYHKHKCRVSVPKSLYSYLDGTRDRPRRGTIPTGRKPIFFNTKYEG